MNVHFDQEQLLNLVSSLYALTGIRANILNGREDSMRWGLQYQEATIINTGAILSPIATYPVFPLLSNK